MLTIAGIAFLYFVVVGIVGYYVVDQFEAELMEALFSAVFWPLMLPIVAGSYLAAKFLDRYDA